MADPVSWLVIERGWKLLAADGSEVGTVEAVIGDSGKDIFNGLAVSTGLLSKTRYVPAEDVREIVEGAVTIGRSPEEVERLEAYEQPPGSAQIRPE